MSDEITVHVPPPNANGSTNRANLEAHLPPSNDDEPGGHLVFGGSRVVGFSQWDGEDGWHVWAVDKENVWMSDELTIEEAAWYVVANVLTTWVREEEVDEGDTG